MIRCLRVVMPPWWAVAIAVAVYLGLEALLVFIEWRFQRPFYSLEDANVSVRMMEMFAVLYALFRVWAFHPALRPAYRRWLGLTPWTGDKPLPLGPIQLVWQDALLLALAVGLCWPRAGIEALAVVRAFFVGYLAVMGFVHAYTGKMAWAYPIAFGLGFMILFERNPLFYLIAGALYIVALLGLRASLARFPWQEDLWFQNLTGLNNGNALGWPFARLGPGRSKQFKLSDVFLAGLLAGWAVFVGGVILNADLSLVTLAVFYAALMRILIYCQGYAPPLSLLGRLRLGRLIIPGYDKVFIAPLLSVLVYEAAAMPTWNGVPRLVAISVGVTASWWVLFGMGPSLEAWRLTGNHRIVKGIMMMAGQQKR